MLNSFSEFKFYQSFRIPVSASDEMRFLVQLTDEAGTSRYLEDAELMDISVTGMGFSTTERISVNCELAISLQFKKMHIDLTGRIVRAFSNAISDKEIIYGIEVDDDKRMKGFLEKYIMSFSPDRLKECLIASALKEKYTNATDGLEMFSLLLSLFKDITHFGGSDGFVDSLLEEVVRNLNAQRASVFLINSETNELEAVAAMGVEKDSLKFDYRLGIAGSVFTTGVALNIDTINDKSRFNDAFDRHYNYVTKSIICYPVHNREDKIIGVIEVLNKRNQDRFTVEDEKTMKVLALVFSAVFHKFNPMSEKSRVRRFSAPFDRDDAIIGQTPHVTDLRKAILKIKDIDGPVLVTGEVGVGKGLFARIIHFEGQRGLKPFEIIDCQHEQTAVLEKKLFGPTDEVSALTRCQGGTVVLKHLEALPLEFQKRLYNILSAHGLPESKISIDVRMVATTSADLCSLVSENSFDENLYNYFNKTLINLWPLRRRADDIEELTNYFLKNECKKQGLLLKSFSPKAMEKLKNHDWQMNISELKKVVERIVLYNPKTHIITHHEMESTTAVLFENQAQAKIFGDMPYVHESSIPLKDRAALVEREMILAEIKKCNGNKSKAAKDMGISREALRKKLLISDEILLTLNNNAKKAA